ncbi:MAG: cyclomaltodextrinase [Fibromonadaceae bacterium]|nr:cyclomaltodextrinase [Fibromonadaceae bacterium]
MERKWFENAQIYHIYALSVAGAPFMNDYAVFEHKFGVIEKWIPHIKGMGFNTVLFSPVLKSRSHGYDVSDYFEIDNRLGTSDEFKSLVKKMHDNGIRVLLDSVFNHSGRDFFAFKKLQQNERNFANWFSGVNFDKRSPMGDQFDYHTWAGFYELPKFNLQNQEIKKYLLDAALFWIDNFDIDGMRLDAADVLDFNFMKELRQITKEKKTDFWLMGEVVHGDYSRWVNDSTLHSVTNYMLYKSIFSSHNNNNLYELAHCLKNAVPQNGLPLYTFLDNHDQPRIASNISKPEYLFTLYTLLFTLPGIPSVYYGSEWGIKGVKEKGSDQALRPYIDIEKSADYSNDLTEHISKLAHLRQNENALKYGKYLEVSLEYKKPFIFERCFEEEKIYIAVNIDEHETFINLSTRFNGALLDILNDECLQDTRNIQIKPYTVKILKECKT